MAISAFATGVTWRIMYQQDPNLGAVNALGRVGRRRSFNPPGVALRRAPVDAGAHRARPQSGHRAEDAAPPGRRRAARADRRSRPSGVPTSAKQAVAPRAEAGRHRRASSGATSSPAAACPARSRRASSGCPGVTVQLRDASDKVGQDRDERPTTARSTSRTSRPGTYHAGDLGRRRSRSRGAASPGSARS